MEYPTLDFDQVYEAYHARVQRHLARLVGEDEAEDLVQVVFTRVSQNLHTFRGEAQLSTWIFRIAANAAFDRMRQPSFRQKKQALSLDGSDENDGEIAGPDAWSGGPAPSLEQQIYRKQREECYCEFLNNLPESYRPILLLSEIEGFCAREIADILGLRVDVVKIRLHRGREKLLQALKDHCRPEDWL